MADPTPLFPFVGRFGYSLRSYRDRVGLSNRELSNLLGLVGVRELRRIFDGKIMPPIGKDFLQKLRSLPHITTEEYEYLLQQFDHDLNDKRLMIEGNPNARHFVNEETGISTSITGGDFMGVFGDVPVEDILEESLIGLGYKRVL